MRQYDFYLRQSHAGQWMTRSERPYQNTFTFQSLCGAGGGGFMAVITKKRSAMSEVEGLLARNQLASCTVHEVQISHEGLTVTKGDVPIEIQP